MKSRFVERSLGWLLAALLAAPFGEALPRQQAVPAQPSQSSSSTASQADNPGLERRAPNNVPGVEESNPGQANSSNQAGGENPALGAAAAPYENPSGVAASRPAGAVIAPAKQKRVRSILIKIGIVVGAGAAVAAVALLSHSSPSRP